jgi:hypothetical protein
VIIPCYRSGFLQKYRLQTFKKPQLYARCQRYLPAHTGKVLFLCFVKPFSLIFAESPFHVFVCQPGHSAT